MNYMYHRYSFLLLFFVLVLFSSPANAAQKTSPAEVLHLTGHVYYANIEGGFYGILGDDGIKYQPVNLPRKFKKEGLSLTFDAANKNNTISTFQWGTIVELSNVKEFTTAVSKDERKAISALLKRMDAFNTKDLTKLQQIDIQSRQLTNEQFQSWVQKYHHYTLQYVDIFSADSTEIIGACYYTRELINGMTRYGTTDLASMGFTLNLTPTGWKIINVGALENPIFNYQGDALADLKKKTTEKYKTDNLAAFGQ